MSTSYSEKEISEWNSTDLSDWLLDNKYRGISELCQKYSLSGYDLFFITDDILKNELGLNSFHERIVTKKLIKKLTSEHLKLNIINSNGDNVILTLDNNQDTSLGELSEYIGRMFNIDSKDILYKDTSKTEVLSPSLKIIKLLILYPRLYKTLNVFDMKDYRQQNDNENENDNLESKNNDYNSGINNPGDGDVAGSENESDFQKSNVNKNSNVKMNFDYNLNRPMNVRNERGEKYDKNRFYNENRKNNNSNNKMIYEEDYDIKNMNKYANERRNKNENYCNVNNDDNENEKEEEKWRGDSNDLKYRIRTNYRDNAINNNNNNNSNEDGYYSLRNKRNINFNDKSYKDNNY